MQIHSKEGRREASEKSIYKKLKRYYLGTSTFFNVMFGVTETFGEEIFQQNNIQIK